jgi:polysaccharide biosynthesis protein PslG
MPPHSSLRRRAARTALVLAAAIAAVASAPPARAAELGQAVLQPHEPAAAPLRWEGVHAGLRLVRPRATTPFARVTMAARSGRFWIFRSPRPVRVTDTGTDYTSSAWVRAARPLTVCVRLRESIHGRPVGSARACVWAKRGWRRIPELHYRAREAGTTLGLAVFGRGVEGERFDVRGVRLLAARPAPTAAPGPEFGTQFHCTWSFYNDADRAAVLDKLAAAGVHWVRIDLGWASLQAERGQLSSWYVDVADRCVDLARARGLRVLATLWATPGWANGGGPVSKPPADIGDYAWIARWAADHFRGRVAAWEIWNEPDPTQSFWTGTAQQYVSLLAAAYPAIKAADRNTLVILGGSSTNNDAWLRQLYRLGAKPYFDVVATHPYQGLGDAAPNHPDDGNRWWFTHLPAVRQVMVDNGDAAKEIWLAEFGWSQHANWDGIAPWARGVTPDQQASYLVQSVNLVKQAYPYVGAMFWYKERAQPGSTNAILEGYALLNADLSPRPVYSALATLLHG